MDDGLLQVRGVADIIAGGYDGEIKGVEPGYADWTDVNYSSDGVTSSYFYSDSNVLPVGPNGAAANRQRSQTNVTVETKWSAELDDQNVFTITTETYLVGISRVARPEGSSGDIPGPGRDIYIFEPNVACNAGAAKHHWFVPYNANGSIYSGNMFISKLVYRLAPGETSGAKSAVAYRNVTQGYSQYLCVDSDYTDAMVIGFQFRNNMPTKLPDPVHTGTNQYEDICENYVDVELIFAAPPVNGVELYLEWRYPGENWSEQKSVKEPASRTTQVSVLIHAVAPTNHTATPVIIEWRAKFRPTSAKMEESDWTYGETQIKYVPAPNMTVPDITIEECTAIGKGDYIPPYTEEQCYTETVCEEQDKIRDELQKREWEKNRECRVVNNVATPEDLEILAKGDK